MPSPKSYAGSREVIMALKRYPWLEWFKTGRVQERNSDLKLIIKHSVGPNIFRAFRHLPMKPSVIFRDWAYECFSKQFLTDFRNVSSRSHYRKWVYEVSDSMQRRWKRATGAMMAPGPSLKLANLIAKRLCLFREIPVREFERLVWFLEVPLDIYTIQAMANCVPGFPDHEEIGRIPKAATMGFVTNKKMYEAFQDGIRQLTDDAGVPPIAFDCLAWDSSH